MEKESRSFQLQGSLSSANLRLPSWPLCLQLGLKMVGRSWWHRDAAQPSRGRGHILQLSCCHPTCVCREDEAGGTPDPCQGYKMPEKRHDSLWHMLLALETC